MAKEKEENNNLKSSASYGAKDIYVLEGLDPVRKRPGMYIGSTGTEGLHHLIWEVVDNSIDEAMAGFANSVTIELLSENKVSVEDNGRGIPVDIHAQTKKSALETVLTTLHAGGKFGGDSYKVSGGLHGVGVSVVNALSTHLKVEVNRDGGAFMQEYKKGVPVSKVKKIGSSSKTGTKVIFSPDPEIFSEIEFNLKKVIDHLRQQAYLTRGLRINIIDRRDDTPEYYGFYFEGGVKSFVKYLANDAKLLQDEIFYVHKMTEKMEVEASFTFTDEFEVKEMSFANNIYTPDGGMHLTGFRSALTRTLNNYARSENYLKEKDDNLTSDDTREGLMAIVSLRLPEPQFEGQTKARLGTPEARTVVESVVNEALKDFLEKHPQEARAIVEKVILSAKARKAAKAAKETVLRKGAFEGLTLPGKLADCTSKSAEESEMFIVEGDSAGGSAKSGRDRRTQAILPLKGKILNVEKARLDKMLTNAEIRSLVIAMGAAIAEEFDLSKVRYHKIVIMTDADVDGAHIRTLLLTLFYRYFPQIIESGYLYIAQPPLYKVHSGKRQEYVFSDAEKDKTLEEFKKANLNPSIQRYKGLGEMNPEELWETTMNPENRVLRQVAVEDAGEADRLFQILMGDDVAPRKHFIQTHAATVKDIDI